MGRKMRQKTLKDLGDSGATLAGHLKGGAVDRRVDTGVTLVTRENMNQPEVRELLRPDLSQWLK